MPKLGAWLVVTFCLASPLAADMELVYTAHSPEMVSPNGAVSGGRTTKKVLWARDRVRVDDLILQHDKGVLYWLRPESKWFCKAKLPVDPRKEMSAELYENLYVNYPKDDGPPTVRVSPLGPWTIGGFATRGFLIEIHHGPDFWRKVSVWTTEDLPSELAALLAELNRSSAPSFRDRGLKALHEELAKLPGVLVRREDQIQSSMMGTFETSQELVSVHEKPLPPSELEPPKGFRKTDVASCWM